MALELAAAIPHEAPPEVTFSPSLFDDAGISQRVVNVNHDEENQPPIVDDAYMATRAALRRLEQ